VDVAGPVRRPPVAGWSWDSACFCPVYAAVWRWCDRADGPAHRSGPVQRDIGPVDQAPGQGRAGIVAERCGAGEVHGGLRAGLRAVAAALRTVRRRDGNRDHAVHAYRPHPDGAPVVLLAGAGGNAAFWFPQVAALAADGPVYGIDMPGDANPSIARALMTPPASCARRGWTSCWPGSATARRTWSASPTAAGSP